MRINVWYTNQTTWTNPLLWWYNIYGGDINTGLSHKFFGSIINQSILQYKEIGYDCWVRLQSGYGIATEDQGILIENIW
jgi:hypothetical protein